MEVNSTDEAPLLLMCFCLLMQVLDDSGFFANKQARKKFQLKNNGTPE